VWALLDYGFEAVISTRFGDIFANNCSKQGLLAVKVEPDVAAALLSAVQADPTLEITVDVQRGSVEAPAAGITAPSRWTSSPDPAAQRLDDIGLTLRYEDRITAFEATRPSWRPSASVGQP